jgi:hypothetical protein
MSPGGHGAKNGCAGESQQQLTRPELNWPVVRPPPLVKEEEDPFQNTQKFGKNKKGSETKNNCTGEGQQQFIRLDWTQLDWDVSLSLRI